MQPLKPCQKLAQRDCAAMQDLAEICALWCHISPDLQTYLGAGEEMDKIEAMWAQGLLDTLFGWVARMHVSRGCNYNRCTIWPEISRPFNAVVFKNRDMFCSLRLGGGFRGCHPGYRIHVLQDSSAMIPTVVFENRDICRDFPELVHSHLSCPPTGKKQRKG